MGEEDTALVEEELGVVELDTVVARVEMDTVVATVELDTVVAKVELVVMVVAREELGEVWVAELVVDIPMEEE